MSHHPDRLLSHFLDADLAAAGGVAAYLTHWLDREAATKARAKTEAAWRQLDLVTSSTFTKHTTRA